MNDSCVKYPIVLRNAPAPLGQMQLSVLRFLREKLPILKALPDSEQGKLPALGDETESDQQKIQNPGTLLITVALSAGSDSLALAAACKRVCCTKSLHPWWSGPVKLIALSVDHGWRCQSAEDARAAAKMALDLGFDAAYSLHQVKEGQGDICQLLIEEAETGQANTEQESSPKTSILPLQWENTQTLGPEAQARQWRWTALAAGAAHIAKQTKTLNGTQNLEPKSDTVLFLTGHTRDDQAETVLLGLARGSGARSLSAMPYLSLLASQYKAAGVQNDATGKAYIDHIQTDLNLWVGKPLLEFSKIDTIGVCKQLGIKPIEDPTNKADGPVRTSDGQSLRRAAVRDRVMPVLASALGQDPRPALAKTARQLREDNEALDWYARQALQTAKIDLDPYRHEKMGENETELEKKTEKEETPYAGAVNNTSTVKLENNTGKERKSLYLKVILLKNLPLAVLKRVMRLAALETGAQAWAIKTVHVEQMAELITNWNGQGLAQLPGVDVNRKHGYLIFNRR